MRIMETKVYQYDELSDKAKEKAREWYASLEFSDPYSWEYVYEDAVRVARLIGISIDHQPVRLMGGGTRYKPSIYFSGFSSQGDGASFIGSYSYAPGGLKHVKAYAPQDLELHRIAKGLQDIQRKFFYKLAAKITTRGSYCHSACMHVSVEHLDDPYRDVGEAEDEVQTLLRDFADWIYARLEEEYKYLISDEQVEESIRANEYEFDEDGDMV